MYLGDRLKALNLKTFIMDLAGIVAELQRKRVAFSTEKQLISPVSRPVVEQGIAHPCIVKHKTLTSNVLFCNLHKFI